MTELDNVASASETEYLEWHLRNYEDMPREVILKMDLLRVGHWFTDAALELASDALVKSYRLISYDLIPMKDMKRKEYRKTPEWFAIRGGHLGLRPVIVQTTLDPSSPYVIDVIDGQVRLLLDGHDLCDVSFPKPLKYYTRSFEDGTKYHEIIAFGYFATVFRNCQYWGPDEECRFCDINVNVRQMKESRDFTFNTPVKPVAYVAEVARSIEQALKWGGHRRYINIQTNAKDKETMKRYRAAGVDCHHANMEVWDKRLFEWINPGKARRIGWDKWVRWMFESVEVLGEGNARPNFVCGVELARPHGFDNIHDAIKSTSDGVEFMMQHGVFPRFNQWRREPGSDLVSQNEQPAIPLEFYIQIMRRYYESWTKYRLPFPHHDSVHPERRWGSGHATYDDMIFLNNWPNYEEEWDRGSKEGLKACVTKE